MRIYQCLPVDKRHLHFEMQVRLMKPQLVKTKHRYQAITAANRFTIHEAMQREIDKKQKVSKIKAKSHSSHLSQQPLSISKKNVKHPLMIGGRENVSFRVRGKRSVTRGTNARAPGTDSLNAKPEDSYKRKVD